jgi:hypothetical protein
LINKPSEVGSFTSMLIFGFFSSFTYYYNNDTDSIFKINQIAKNRFKKIMDISVEGIIIIKE